MQDELDTLYAAWRAGDETAGLVVADLLEERGDELADPIRWIAERGKRPMPRARGRWEWWSGPPDARHRLPRGGGIGVHASFRVAMEEAARSLLD